MKAALYIRVSTHKQEDRDSLPFQKEETRNYAKYTLKVNDYEYFIDAGKSAKNTDRPEFQHMMRRVKAGEFTHLVIWKIDRISRSVKDFALMYEELNNYGVQLISVTEQFNPSTPMGMAMLQIIMVFAELERGMTSERVQAIMLSRAQKGLWNGATVPIGYKWCDKAKYPVVCPEEKKVVQLIYDLYLKNASTLETASILNERNVPTKRGGAWVAKTVRDVLRNPFYIGTYRYNMRDNSNPNKTYVFKDKSEWIVIKNNHEAIIEYEAFEKVGKMLSRNYKGVPGAPREMKHVHIFAKKLYCANCGQNMTAGLDSARKDGYRPSRYVCSSYHNKGVKNYCSNFVSDILLGPFIFSYIANLIKLQNNVDDQYTLKKIERALLRGNIFHDVLGIDDMSLKNTHELLVGSYDQDLYENEIDESTVNVEYESLLRDKKKYEVALERLDDLFLFSSAGMSKKDYVLKKEDIATKLERVDKNIDNLKSKQKKPVNHAFIDKVVNLVMYKEFNKNGPLDYRYLLDMVGEEVLFDLIYKTIDRIVISDKRVSEIVFRNGVSHRIAYKENKKSASDYVFPKHGAYRIHFDDVLEYVKEHGHITRPQVESLVNIKRHSALKLLNELISLGKLERRRHSNAIGYYLK